LALAAETAVAKAHPGAPPLAFHRALMERARQKDGLFDQEDWLQVLAEASGSAELAGQARGLITAGGAEAAPRLARLFTAAGVAYRLDGSGHIRLDRLPKALFTPGLLSS
jgi:hypothetical protein